MACKNQRRQRLGKAGHLVEALLLRIDLENAIAQFRRVSARHGRSNRNGRTCSEFEPGVYFRRIISNEAVRIDDTNDRIVSANRKHLKIYRYFCVLRRDKSSIDILRSTTLNVF